MTDQNVQDAQRFIDTVALEPMYRYEEDQDFVEEHWDRLYELFDVDTSVGATLHRAIAREHHLMTKAERLKYQGLVKQDAKRKAERHGWKTLGDQLNAEPCGPSCPSCSSNPQEEIL